MKDVQSLNNGPEWGWMTQILDYSNPENTTTWRMRYVKNEEFFTGDGPIFILLGGEYAIHESSVQSDTVYDLAREHNATMYYIEHRYYGQSYPTSDLTTDNLKYLKVEFALEDFANFIRNIKQENVNLTNNKVVVFGASYSGNLAIWMRQKYPELVHAAVSSSAPVLAKYNFFEYNEVVKSSLGTECSGVIERGIKKTQDLLQTRKGRKKLSKDFSFAVHFGVTVQYGNPLSIHNECAKLMSSADGDDYVKLAAYMKKQSYGCTRSYETFRQSLVNTENDIEYRRQWKYQKCTEFGYFKTSTKPYHLFSNTLPIKIYQRICQDIFGSFLTSNVTEQGVVRINEMYGGLQPNVTRVISLHGSLDPWHALGLAKDLNPAAPIRIIRGASHGADMDDDSDSPALRKVKTAVKTYLKQWLQED
ncbi:uncharacterized protein CBL_02717 [Carabus blaptoides fortunei]